MENNDQYIVLDYTNYHVAVVNNQEQYIEDEFAEDDELLDLLERDAEIYGNDEHPWDLVSTLRYRHRPEIWLYGYNFGNESD